MVPDLEVLDTLTNSLHDASALVSADDGETLSVKVAHVFVGEAESSEGPPDEYVIAYGCRKFEVDDLPETTLSPQNRTASSD